MVVLHNPSTITIPAAVLQVLGGLDYAFNRIAVTPKHWPDPDTYGSDDVHDDRVYWYVVHGMAVLGQMLWGLPLIWAARRNQRNRVAAWLFFASCVIAGVVTAVPIIRVSNQRANFGLGVYSSSVLYNVVYFIYLLDIGKGLLLTPLPTDYLSRQESHHFIGRLQAFQWYSGFQLVVFTFRYRLVIFPVLNAVMHYVCLLWHFYMLFYFGSHKPRYESATGLVEDQHSKKDQ